MHVYIEKYRLRNDQQTLMAIQIVIAVRSPKKSFPNFQFMVVT